MTVNVSELTPPTDCTPGFGTTDDATFTFHTAQIPPSADDLTFVSPGLGAIMPVDPGESFALRFDGGVIDDTPDGDTVDNWFPAAGQTTSLIGNTISWSQTQSPTDADCNGEVVNNGDDEDRFWRVEVTNLESPP